MAGQNAAAVMFGLIIMTWMLRPALIAYINPNQPHVMEQLGSIFEMDVATANHVPIQATNCTIAIPRETLAYDALLICALPSVKNVMMDSSNPIRDITINAYAKIDVLSEEEHHLAMKMIVEWTGVILGLIVLVALTILTLIAVFAKSNFCGCHRHCDHD